MAELIQVKRITLNGLSVFARPAGISLKRPVKPSKKSESEVGYAKQIGCAR
jgi:hypothetical protein